MYPILSCCWRLRTPDFLILDISASQYPESGSQLIPLDIQFLCFDPDPGRRQLPIAAQVFWTQSTFNLFDFFCNLFKRCWHVSILENRRENYNSPSNCILQRSKPAMEIRSAWCAYIESLVMVLANNDRELSTVFFLYGDGKHDIGITPSFAAGVAGEPGDGRCGGQCRH